jgi:Ca-activated chloride channel family protein
MNAHTISIHWARPDLLIVLAIIIVASGLLSIYRLHKTDVVASLLSNTASKKKLLLNYSYPINVIKVILFVVSVLFLCVALLRPQWNEVESPIAHEGRDVLIALDISRSMLAQDVQPDRLQYAKAKIKQLIKRLKSERVGLMLFSGSTFLQCPLTEDKSAFLMFLDAIDVETISSGTTAFDQAIKEAIAAFEKMPERKSKLLIIFTDGEDFSSNLTSIKKRAAAIGLHIITVGVGTSEGAPIPLYDERGKQIGHQLDAKNNVVISRMNEGILHRLSEDTGGLFVPISSDDSDIRKMKKFIASFEKERLADKQVKRYQEQYAWPLLISFFCLLIEWLL